MNMKYISALLYYFRPMQLLMPILLSAVLFIASGCTSDTTQRDPVKEIVKMENTKNVSQSAIKNTSTKGTVQLDEIEKKAEESIDSPATSLETIEERSKGALNEVQGDAADRNKMNRSNDQKLPVVKQTEKVLNKMKNG
jgi:hypothetical protein